MQRSQLEISLSVSLFLFLALSLSLSLSWSLSKPFYSEELPLAFVNEPKFFMESFKLSFLKLIYFI